MRILLADKQPNVRFALRALLGQQPGMEVIGEAADVEELVVVTEATAPDVLLMDWKLPGMAMGDSLLAVRSIAPGMRIIILSARPEVSVEALSAGADAFVSKADPPERLLATIVNHAHRVDAEAKPEPADAEGCGDSRPRPKKSDLR